MGCTTFVYTEAVQSITLSADERLIEAAREIARESNRTLNDAFRGWLAAYVAADGRAKRAESTLARLSKTLRTGGQKFPRQEMNER